MSAPSNWTWPSRPTNEDEFDAMMTSLDRHLADRGLQPFQRGMHAVPLVSNRLGLSGHSLFPSPEQRGAPFSPTDLLGRVHDWYDANYGDRMHMEMSPGSVVFPMHGTLWLLSLPRVWGSVQMFIDQDLTNTGVRIGAHGQQASLNILTSIRGMTQAHARRLQDEDFRTIMLAFQRGWSALNFLDGLTGHAFFDQARNDRKLAVISLMEGNSHKARWDTAQCAEKVFKGLLAGAGHAYPTSGTKGHDIPFLGALVSERLGANLPEQDLVSVHCATAIRYAELPSSQEDAVSAHDALLRLLDALSGYASQSRDGSR